MKLLAVLLLLIVIWLILAVIINHDTFLIVIRSLFEYNFCDFHPLERWCAPDGVRIGMTR